MLKIETVNPSGVYITLETDRDLMIDREQLTENMERQPGLFAHYALLAAYARSRVRTLTREVKVQKAHHHNAWEGEKKYLAEAALETKEEYKKLVDELLTWEYRVDQLEAVVEALKQRKDLLQSIGLRLRESFQGEQEVRTLTKSKLVKLRQRN